MPKSINESDTVAELTHALADREFRNWLNGEAKEEFILALQLLHDGDFVPGRLRMAMQQAFRKGYEVGAR